MDSLLCLCFFEFDIGLALLYKCACITNFNLMVWWIKEQFVVSLFEKERTMGANASCFICVVFLKVAQELK